MKKLTNYGKMLVCMVLVLILSIGATIGITMTYFGDSKSGSVEIKIGASIYFDETNGVGVAVQDGTTAIVPSQSVDVTTTLLIKSSSDTNVTNGVLKVIPDLTETLEGVGLTLTDGKTYDVYLGGSTTASTTAKMVVANNALYLVKASNSTDNTSTTLNELYEITPSTSGLSIKFSVPVTFSSDINNDLSGQSCTIEMKGIVLQSAIVDDEGNDVAQTIDDFDPYFIEMVPVPHYVTLNTGDIIDLAEYYGSDSHINSSYEYHKFLYYTVDGSDQIQTYVDGTQIKVYNKIWVSTSNELEINVNELPDVDGGCQYYAFVVNGIPKMSGECFKAGVNIEFAAVIDIDKDSTISLCGCFRGAPVATG